MKMPSTAGRISQWRMDMKRDLYAKRGWRCERQGCKRRAEHLDEGIITRGDMRGFSKEQKRIAFAECNLFLVCAECNMTRHDREWAWDLSCKRYGEETMREWYKSLNLKAPRKEWL